MLKLEHETFVYILIILSAIMLAAAVKKDATKFPQIMYRTAGKQSLILQINYTRLKYTLRF